MARQHKRGIVGAVLVMLIAGIVLVLSPDDQQPEEPVSPPGMDNPVSSPPELQPESMPPEPAEPATEPQVPSPEMTPESMGGSTTSLAAGEQVLDSADGLTLDLPSSSSDGTGSSISSPTTASTSTSPSIPEATSPTATENNKTLEFHFTDACWLEVVDANGERIIAREAQSGDNLRLSGSAPFSIVLGNAPAASIAIDGEPVDIKPRSSTNVLRLNLGGDS